VQFYMTYERRLSDDEFVALLGRCRELGILVCAHCEDHEMLEGLRQGFVREGKLNCRYHALSRPPAAEAKAVAHLIELAARAGDAPVYIVHTSSAEGLEAALPLPDNVFLETCPQYLLLNDSLYDAPDGEGLKYIMSPPLRKPSDQEALWAAIKAGHINVIATDHCPWNFAKEKQLGKGDFTLCPNGAPGVELRMPLMYTEAVIKRGINLSRFVDICCAAPAKRFGLYPRKGTLAPGSDADVVLFDTLQQMVRHERLHENVDYTPYEGMIVCGYPVMTLSRGKIMMRNGEYCGGEAHGRYLHRDVS
jgi:dihydropyrimidinase